MVDFRNDDTDGDDVVENVDQENDITADDADAADDDDDNAGGDQATTATTSITATVDDFRQYIQSVVGSFSRQPPNRHHNGIIIRTTIRNAMNQMLDSGRSNEQDQQRFIECLNMLANEYQELESCISTISSRATLRHIVIPLYTDAIGWYWNDTIHHRRAHHHETTLPLLLTGLCHFLRDTQDFSLLVQAARTIAQTTTTKVVIAGDEDDDDDHPDDHATPTIPDTLYQMVTNGTTNIQKDTERLVPTMIALGYTVEQPNRRHDLATKGVARLEDDDATAPPQSRWIAALVDDTTHRFPDATELVLVHYGLLTLISTEVWQSPVLLPALLLKLKSHPDRMLSTFYGYIVRPPSSHHQCRRVGLPTITEEFISVLIKQLTHVERATNRNYATTILCTWAMNDWYVPLASATTTITVETNAEESRVISSSLAMICQYMTTSMKPIPTVSVARTAIYQLLEQLAIGYQNESIHRDMHHRGVISNELVDVMLSFLYQMIQKEMKNEVRMGGFQALTEWLIVYKTMERRVNSDTTSTTTQMISKSYETILQEFIRTPLLQQPSTGAAKKVLSETVIPLLTLLVKRVVETESILSSIVADIWASNNDVKTWDKAIETIVTTSSSKKSTVTDAVLFLYLTVLNYRNQCTSSSTSNNPKAIPAWIPKLLTGGNSKGNTISSSATNATIASAGKIVESNISFFCSMMDVVTSNAVVNTLFPRIIALYSECCCFAATAVAAPKGKMEIPSLLFLISKSNEPTLSTNMIALCIMSPFTLVASPTSSLITSQSKKRQLEYSRHYASHAIAACLKPILRSQPFAGVALISAVFDQINHTSIHVETMAMQMNATREARENEIVKGNGGGYNSDTVRRFTKMIAREETFPIMVMSHADKSMMIWSKVLVLTHIGTTIRRMYGPQRSSLILNTAEIIRILLKQQNDMKVTHNEWCNMLSIEILNYLTRKYVPRSTAEADDGNDTTSSATTNVSNTVHRAALSLIISLGRLAVDKDDENSETGVSAFCKELCVKHIAPLLAEQLRCTQKSINDLTVNEIDLYKSPIGTLFRTEKALAIGVVKSSGKRLTEDEEWEEQLKKEIAEKQGATVSGTDLSADDKKLLQQQDAERQQTSKLVHVEYVRIVDAIRYLCMSDIEIGNECLPAIGDGVLSAAVSTCPAFRCISGLTSKSLEALTTLGCCVYEIHEDHARAISTALIICCRTLTKSKENSNCSNTKDLLSLPSPCIPAATVISEMQNYGDTLSGASFVFLFPIIAAALFGPRTPIGCEGALKLLHQHTMLLYGDLFDPNVFAIRKDMVVAILELLKHDRSQTFHNPSPLEALAACYYTDAENSLESAAFTVSELAPLLDGRGALGSKDCRVGAMFALSCIAERHSKMLKANLLVENRVWLNCFDKDYDVRSQARKTWSMIHGVDYEVIVADESLMPRPSPLYAPPLLSLLSHADLSISLAAADAYARAMAMHEASINRNISILCVTYIDSFPTPTSAASGNSKTTPTTNVSKGKPLASMAPAPKKITTGLPKAKAPPKSALAIAGIGQPKPVVKKKSVATSVLLKPKQERTLDQATLDSQFKMNSPIEVEKEKEKDSIEKVAIRKGVLRAMTAFSTSSVKVTIGEESLKLLTSFLIAYGIADSDDSVQGAARDTLRDVVASNGGSSEAISFLLPLLEAVLKTGTADESTLGSLPKVKVPKSVTASDRRKEGTVVALGSVALHLQGPENDAKVESSVDMLIDALKTPSEEVQSSVAEALAKLMKKGQTQFRIEGLLTNLLRDCLHGDSLAVRRGAAYGLAAAVKGSGITTLKKYEIVKQLEEACSNGNTSSKEGSLFAIELLTSRLGLLFEPYVIVLLPSLLQAFSDNSDYVRNAASHTTGLIMSKLSAHGVKLVMPAVLSAFNDPAWRTKQASIHMLGAMSHLAPKQLASALPKVVPKLTEAFSDTHAKVKASAQEALNEISTVVKNPEIASICPTLLKALTDPADNTAKALEALIATEFLHAIDSPSLALIAPILHRGLRDRGATTKRASSLITGNICSMINDPKDFVPYLPTLLPDLQASLLDPIPDVRSTSAHALGSLTRSLGEVIVLDLRPWLIERLRDENCSSAERSGAAQGLTEVLIAAGSAMVEGTMRTEILPLRCHPSASTREGVQWMLTFLPPSMGQGFTPLIDVSLPALIGGLSDDSEAVRDVALRAGRVLIRSHGKVHVDKILPNLEAGLISDDHRIRIASLSLLGDLLSLIGGTQLAKGESDTQDDIRKAERAQAQIALVLGAESRKRVLSGLYMARSDSVHMVRQSAIQVWKTVVSVTVRALRDILPVLVARIIDDLASGHYEKTEIAGRCLGDIVGKLGDSVLPQIVPVLRKALYDGDVNTKRGVCVGLTEVIQCSNKEQILRFLEIIIPVVRDALSDDSEIVRKMAATSFQSLYAAVGNRVMDEIVPTFMVALESGEHNEGARMRALNGLTGILGVRSRELLPYIIPRLIKRPITTNQAEVLAGIARVTGSTIHFHLSAIIPALIFELSEADGKDDAKEQALRLCARAICGSVDTIGVNWLFSEIVAKCGSDKASLRRESCCFLDCAIIERAEKEDFYEQIPIMMREMLYRLNDDNEAVLKANHAAWTSLSIKVPAEELVKHVEFMKGLIASMVSDARRRKGGVGDGEFLLPGLNMTKGVEPLIPIYQRGILYGSPVIREVSAAGLGELIDYTSTKYLAGPLIVKMTGPLLRIVGDRNPSNVKVAILKTLGRVLIKGGPALRAFVPQFQTTFVKALSDPSRQVRVEAIAALSLLMPLATRVDPLIKELVTGSLGRNVNVEGLAATVVQTATLDALAAVLEQGGSKVKLPDSVPAALDASKQLLVHPDEGIRESAAKVMGMSCAMLGVETTQELLLSDVFVDSGKDGESTIRHGRACAIRRILVSTTRFKIDPAILERLTKVSLELIKDEKSIVREPGFAALGAAIGRTASPKNTLKGCEAELLKVMRDTKETLEIHRAVARCLCVALLVVDKATQRVDFLGLNMMDACLNMALKGMQRVQYSFYDVLWLALNVQEGEAGLNRYCELTLFDNQRAIKSLHSKVLSRMKEITTLER